MNRADRWDLTGTAETGRVGRRPLSSVLRKFLLPVPIIYLAILVALPAAAQMTIDRVQVYDPILETLDCTGHEPGFRLKGDAKEDLSPGERVRLDILLRNGSMLDATDITAELGCNTASIYIQSPRCDVGGGDGVRWDDLGPNELRWNRDPFILDLSQALECYERVEFNLLVSYTQSGSPYQVNIHFALPFFSLYDQETMKNIKFSTSPEVSILPAAAERPMPEPAYGEGEIGLFFGMTTNAKFSKLDINGDPLTDPEDTGYWVGMYRGQTIYNPISYNKYEYYHIDSGGLYVLYKDGGMGWQNFTIHGSDCGLPVGAAFNPKAGQVAVVYTHTLSPNQGHTYIEVLDASTHTTLVGPVDLGIGNKDSLSAELCSVAYMPPINPSDPGFYYVAYAEHDGTNHQLHIEAVRADTLAQTYEVIEALTDEGKPSLIVDPGLRTVSVAFLKRIGGVGGLRTIFGNVYDETLVSFWGWGTPGFQALQMTSYIDGTEPDEPRLLHFYDYILAWNERNTLSGTSGRVCIAQYWPDFDMTSPSWVELQKSYLSSEWYSLNWLSAFMTVDRARVFWQDKRTSTDNPVGIHSATAIPQDPQLPTNISQSDDVIFSQSYETSLHPTLASRLDEFLCAWWYQPKGQTGGDIYMKTVLGDGAPGPAMCLSGGLSTEPIDAEPIAINHAGVFKVFWKGVSDINCWTEGGGYQAVPYENASAKLFDAAGDEWQSTHLALFKDYKISGGDSNFNLYVFKTGDTTATKLVTIPSSCSIYDAAVAYLPGGGSASWAVAWIQDDDLLFTTRVLKFARFDSDLALVGSVQTLFSSDVGITQIGEVEMAANDDRIVIIDVEPVDSSGTTLEVREHVLCLDGTPYSLEPVFVGFDQSSGKKVFNNLQLHWTGAEFVTSVVKLGGKVSEMMAYQYHFLYSKMDSYARPVLWPSRIATFTIRMYGMEFDFDVCMTSSGGAAVYNLDVVTAESNVYLAKLGWKPELQYCEMYNEPPAVTTSESLYIVEYGQDVVVNGTAVDDDMGDYIKTNGTGWDLSCDDVIDKTVLPPVYQSTITRQLQEQNGWMWPTDYCIKLVALDSHGEQGDGWAMVRLTDTQGPTVAVNTPNGGNNLRVGETYTITWEGYDNVWIEHWEVYYTTNYGAADEKWTQIGGNMTEEVRSADWPVPDEISAKCRIKVVAYDYSGNPGQDLSDTNFYIIQNTTSAIRTIILTNTDRLDTYYGSGMGGQVWSKLDVLKKSTKVDGAMVDLKDVPGLDALYSTWDTTPTDNAANRLLNINAANAVAGAIRAKVLDLIANTYQNAEYLVLAGSDKIIPFYRVADGTAISPESSYATYVNADSPVGAAVDRKYYLTDGVFSDITYDTTDAGVLFMALPDLATGRLVETPSEIMASVDTFIAQDGQTNLNQVLVTGYDFLMDSATTMKNSYTGAGKTVHDHISNTGWTASDMESDLFGTSYSLQSINNHCDHSHIGTPGTALSTTQMDTHGDLSLRGKLIYSVGCHSGFNTPDDDFVDDDPLDLPQVMLRKGVMAYIGNTGYGWGMRYGSGYSERLAEMITTRLVSQQSMALGKAMLDAKQEYFLKDHRYDVFDEKILFESTLYGLPMYKVQVSTSLVVPPPKELDGPMGPDYQEVDGIILEKKVSETVGSFGDLPPGVTELTLNFDFTSAYPAMPVTTPDGDYWTLNGLASAELGDTLQPYFTYDSRLSGTVSHGVLFTGGTFVKSAGFNPVVGTADSSSYTPGGESPIGPMAGGFVPTVTATHPSSVSSLVVSDLTRMTVSTGYYESGTETRFNKMNFAMYYSNSADKTSTTITDTGETGTLNSLSGLTASFSVPVSDASGVYRVVIAYTDDQSQWKSLDLALNSTSGIWEGSLECKRNTTYYAQAVDKAGNVGVLRKDAAEDLDYDGNPTGSTYEEPRLFKITLADSDSDTLPDAWEDEYGLDKNDPADAGLDPDYDLLTSLQEFDADTDPLEGDTDGDGDNDGSEKNNGRNPLVAGDGKRITITATKVGDDVRLDWPDGLGDNGAIDGYYWIYRSLDPFFDGTEELDTGTNYPLLDGTITFTDAGGGTGPTYYYTVTNVRYTGPAPFVDLISPSSGPQAGNTLIRIYGDYFASGATVTIGGSTASSITVVNSTTITCRTPASGSTGAKDVRVTNPNGQYGEKTGGFTYY